MKKHLALAAILAATLAASAAQAQSIGAIARFADYTVGLSDMPCPENQWAKTAIYNSYGPDRGTAYGCWTGGKVLVSIRWFRVNTTRTPPEKLDSSHFEQVTN